MSEIIQDKEALSIKTKMMEKMKWNALLGSIADVCKFVAGPVLGVGIGIAGTGIGLAGAIPAFIAAGAILAVGITASFAATRIWQSGQFDNFEINAQSTARHLVQELKVNSMCAVEHEQNCRADGKSWVQAVRPQQLPVPSLDKA